MVVIPEVPPYEAFLAQAVEKRRAAYLSTSFDMTPPGAPTQLYASVRDVITYMEAEAAVFRPKELWAFMRGSFQRFPEILPRKGVPPGGGSEQFHSGLKAAVETLVAGIVQDNPDSPRAWFENTLAALEYHEANPPQEATMAEVVEAVPIHMLADDQMQDFILMLFAKADKDSNGVLDRKEFRACLESAELGFNESDVRAVLAAADEDEDGHVSYKEFVPIMLDLVIGIKAKQEAAEAREVADAAAKVAATQMLLHGMTREQLEFEMRRVFDEADADGSGALSRKEFRSCLGDPRLGLSRKEINLLMSVVDVDGDGQVTFNEFAPLAFDVMVQLVADQLQANEALATADGLTQYLLDAFRAVDGESTGLLPLPAVKAVVRELSDDVLALSKMQIVSLLSEAEPDSVGNVNYIKFAPVASAILSTMFEGSAQQRRIAATQELAQTEGAEMLRGLPPDQVLDICTAAFEAADEDRSGFLDFREMQMVFAALGAGELALSPVECNALMAAADPNEDGMVEYGEFVGMVYDVLQAVEREKMVQKVAFLNTDAAVKEDATMEAGY